MHGCVLPREVQWHRAVGAGHGDGFASCSGGEVFFEGRGGAERRRHQQELHLRELQQRHLPGPTALRIGVVVKLVDDDQVDVCRCSLTQREVGENLLGATDHRSICVHRRVAGDHPDIVRAQCTAQREELLRHQRLNRCGVIAAGVAGHAREVTGHTDHRFPRPRRRRQDHMVPGEQFEDGLFLGGVEVQANRS